MFCDSCAISRMCDDKPVTGATGANNGMIYMYMCAKKFVIYVFVC